MTLSTHPRPRLALPPALRPRTTCHTPVSRGRGPTLSSEGSRRGGRQQARDSRRTCILATLGRRPPSIRLHITLSERVPAAGAPLPAFSCRSGRCDRRNITHFPYTMPTAQACASRYSPHTQELHGHALAAVNTGGAMFHPAGSAACLAGAYSGVNSLLGQLHAERVAAGERPHIHDHIATSSTPSTLPSTAPPRPASRSTRAAAESLACVAGARGSWHERESYDQEDDAL